ncbi:sensor histidine kinase [Acidovorax temperans]|uniref:sensor histidine kinase n=1 Tax=Acidovorax temperans TaxID=80878 RepID=UPI0030CAE22C
MLVTRPALFATVCSGLWLLQMGLMGAMAARWWGLWTLTRVQLAWCGAALAGATLLLGALLLAQLPRAARWRPRLTPRASAELQAERKRIARDLHDKLGSQLINALALLHGRTPPDREAQAALEQCMLDLRFVVDSMDARDEPVTTRLARLRHRLQPVLERRGVQLVWNMDLPGHPREPNPHSAELLVSVVQEALSNVLQHSGATKVDISVRYVTATDLWQAEVCDNGRGLDVEQLAHCSGTGIAGMQQRARLAGGQLVLSSQPGEGTRVLVSVPGGEPVV